MSLLEPSDAQKVVPLRVSTRDDVGSFGVATGQIRRQLSLLQGYADLMEGLSPRQAREIMRVMAAKLDDLTETIRPLVDASHETRSGMERKGKRRSQKRESTSRRELLARLRHRVGRAKAGLTPKPPE